MCPWKAASCKTSKVTPSFHPLAKLANENAFSPPTALNKAFHWDVVIYSEIVPRYASFVCPFKNIAALRLLPFFVTKQKSIGSTAV